LAAGVVGIAMLSSPAEARCLWNGFAWHCWSSHQEIRSDRGRVHRERAEIRHDRRHLRHLQARLNRDIHVGSSRDVVRDVHQLRRTHRELREDRSDLRNARRDLRQDRWGY